jgi:integrase
MYDNRPGGRFRNTWFWEVVMNTKTVPSTNKTPTFPETVEYRSASARIYRSRHRGQLRFEVRYYDLDASLQRVTFPDYDGAKEFAQRVVRELADKRTNFVTLRGEDAYDYQRATAQLGPTGLSLPEAVRLVVDNVQLLAGSGSIAEAVRYYVENRPRTSPDITVQEVVDRFLELRQREGEIGELHLRDLRYRLTRFAKEFQCPISKVSTAAIREYLLNLKVSHRSVHNVRTTVSMLFSFARAEGYLPADHKGVPKSTKRRRPKLVVKIFTPEDLAKLLAAAAPEQVVAVSICAFAGLRATELQRLDWQHIDFEQGHILVPDTIAKTGERRLAPLPDNLRAWLSPHRRSSGRVCSYANLAIVYAHLARRAGVKWQRNGLRHSYVSYRLAQLKNVAQVAFEVGNSSQMIFRHYLRVVTEAAGKAWFSICPPQADRVIQLPPAAPTMPADFAVSAG